MVDRRQLVESDVIKVEITGTSRDKWRLFAALAEVAPTLGLEVIGRAAEAHVMWLAPAGAQSKGQQ